MTMRRSIRMNGRACFAPDAALALCLAALSAAPVVGQAPVQSTPTESAPIELDRVVAVVNNQAILSSDIDDEIRLSVLDPGRGGLGVLTRSRALDQLIGRALIQQQIRQEDVLRPPSLHRMKWTRGLRRCARNCPPACGTTAPPMPGWQAFLADARPYRRTGVETYLRYRVEILRFIEQRFRQGISILPQDIETYYQKTLLPQYAKGETVPALETVSSRIQEILLQQQVNALFDDWLNNLRKQGNVEILDPALESPAPEMPAVQTPGSPGQGRSQ